MKLPIIFSLISVSLSANDPEIVTDIQLLNANRPKTPVKPQTPVKPKPDFSELGNQWVALFCFQSCAYDAKRERIIRKNNQDLIEWEQQCRIQLRQFKREQALHRLLMQRYEEKRQECQNKGTFTRNARDMILANLRSNLQPSTTNNAVMGRVIKNR